MLALPELAALFGPGSRAEVPLAGMVGDQVVFGQVDRLAVTADAVLVIDYKTNRAPPATPAEVPVGLSAPDGGLSGAAGGDLSRPAGALRAAVDRRAAL